MERIELELDEQTLERARHIAALRNSTLEALLAEFIDLLVITEGTPDPLLGMFAQEAALIDQVVEQAMTARETDPLRAHSG
jgi:hypothetical protein